jgi:hypothetical protein
VSSAVHQAYIDVDETGTQAAAATGFSGFIDLAIAAAPIAVPFNADHPFEFLIEDNQSGAILFQGKVTDPGADGAVTPPGAGDQAPTLPGPLGFLDGQGGTGSGAGGGTSPGSGGGGSGPGATPITGPTTPIVVTPTPPVVVPAPAPGPPVVISDPVSPPISPIAPAPIQAGPIQTAPTQPPLASPPAQSPIASPPTSPGNGPTAAPGSGDAPVAVSPAPTGRSINDAQQPIAGPVIDESPVSITEGNVPSVATPHAALAGAVVVGPSAQTGATATIVAMVAPPFMSSSSGANSSTTSVQLAIGREYSPPPPATDEEGNTSDVPAPVGLLIDGAGLPPLGG